MGAALDHAGYDRFVTVTRAPQDALQGMSRLANRLRGSGPWEWAWSLERGSKTGVVHAHAVVRAGYVRQADLSRHAVQAGFGPVADVRRGWSAGRYAAKAAGYAAKSSGASYSDWLALNGGKRPWHWSRRYTGGVPMRTWIRANPPPADPGPWVPITGREAKAALVVVLLCESPLERRSLALKLVGADAGIPR